MAELAVEPVSWRRRGVETALVGSRHTSASCRRRLSRAVLALLPWCGVRADRRSPMLIDSRLRRAVQFRCRRRPTTNFTRPHT